MDGAVDKEPAAERRRRGVAEVGGAALTLARLDGGLHIGHSGRGAELQHMSAVCGGSVRGGRGGMRGGGGQGGVRGLGRRGCGPQATQRVPTVALKPARRGTDLSAQTP